MPGLLIGFQKTVVIIANPSYGGAIKVNRVVRPKG